MSEFAQYQKMKQELSDELSKSFHQLLKDNLNATNLARQENQNSEKNLIQEIGKVDAKVERNHEEVKPMLNIFNNVDGAFNVAKWILIGLAGVGAGITGLYYIIQELKKFWYSH